MLENNTAELSGSKMPERCKPDYESIIKNLRTKLSNNLALENAVWGYVGESRLRDKMAEMMGELISEQRKLQRDIDILIKEQENNQN